MHSLVVDRVAQGPADARREPISHAVEIREGRVLGARAPLLPSNHWQCSALVYGEATHEAVIGAKDSATHTQRVGRSRGETWSAAWWPYRVQLLRPTGVLHGHFESLSLLEPLGPLSVTVC